jgi:hypothetical protein
MAKINDLLADDTNQFGPGTDLTISLLAMMLVIALMTSYEYQKERDLNRILESEHGSNFKLATESFTAADFHPRPVTRLVNRAATIARVARIVDEYRQVRGQYPFIFVIGHSNELDDPAASDKSATARRGRNMEFALRRATLIATLMQTRLADQNLDIDRLVAVTTGEADLRDKVHPLSQNNAWVEVVFGKEWKVPTGGR